MPEGFIALYEFFEKTGNLGILPGEIIHPGVFCQLRVEFKKQFRSKGCGGGGQIGAELRASPFVHIKWFD